MRRFSDLVLTGVALAIPVLWTLGILWILIP